MKRFFLPLAILFFLLPSFCAYAGNTSAQKRITVVIDPGHGGKDPGAIGTVLKLKEKDVNLSVALELGRLLYAEPGFKVVFTRKTDVFIPLDERAQKANKEKADLFISIHANASPNKSAYGAETFVVGSSSKENMATAMRENASILYEENYKARYGGFDPNKSESYIMFDMMQSSFLTQSIDLAQRVQKKIVSSCGRADRSVKQAGFLVLRQTNMPSILVELGYLTNAKEEKYLKKESSRKAMAKAIFQAVLDYRNNCDSKTALSEPLEPSPVKPETQPQPVTEVKVDTLKRDTAVAQSVPKVEKAQEVKTNVPEKQDSVYYRVQFCSSKVKLAPNAREFKSCVPAYEYFENNVYKYMYGKATTFSAAVELQKKVRSEFKDAFVVVMKGSKKLPPSEASRYLK